ncbi:Hypothetical predicted protein [Mytilus galloprovincialis]|uniref:B box-type domain-containing protein n=1 Tax=Mytilus galloprovincialis TaxID=29158 RepID=A0A8B6DMW6_MYTGA|nr:Hypothetical predicted protein [Mytilus galloprovincialis]
MAASTTLCCPCSERHITKPSEYWCSECEEAICNDCQEHHRVFKATRIHELIPIDKTLIESRRTDKLIWKVLERKELHLAEIQQRRNQINKHLDKLENEIKQDLEKKEGQCKKSIQSILSSVEEKKNFITEYQTNLQSNNMFRSSTFL